jgi:signal transduction histidine kinase
LRFEYRCERIGGMDPEQTVTKWSRLLRSGAYDLRTGVHVVKGYARWVQSERIGPVTDQQRKALQEIERYALRMHGTLDRLYQLAHWREARLPRAQVETVELLGLVREVTSVLAAQLPDDAWDVRTGAEDVHVRANRQDLTVLIDTVIRCVWQAIAGSHPVVWVMEPEGATAPEHKVVIAPPDHLERALDQNNLQPFTDDRAPFVHALNMAVAARVLAAQDVRVWCFRDMPGAVIVLPRA